VQLQPGEKLIVAYFPSDTQANEAVELLKQKGYTDAQVDQITRFPKSGMYNRTNLSLSSKVLDTTTYDRSLGPLMAADPSVSGMGTGHELPGGTAFLVSLVTDESKVQEAVQILKGYGATV